MTVSRREFLQWSAAASALAATGCRLSTTPAKVVPKRILILGGTGFLGPATIEIAQARGHQVTMFNRGKTRPDLFPGVEKLHGDRDPKKGEGLKALETGTWDAVIDNSAYYPRMVAASAGLLAVSALTGEGIAELRRKIVDQIAPEEGMVPEAGFITSVRHEQRLRESVACLDKARSAAAGGIPHEMLLIDLYDALAALASITGTATADDILNRIFSTFCIGK